MSDPTPELLASWHVQAALAEGVVAEMVPAWLRATTVLTREDRAGYPPAYISVAFDLALGVIPRIDIYRDHEGELRWWACDEMETRTETAPDAAHAVRMALEAIGGPDDGETVVVSSTEETT